MSDGPSRVVAIGVAAASVGTSAVLLLVSGVRHGSDTVRYLDGAAKILAGRPLVGMQRLFPGYSGLLALSTAIGTGERGVIAFQIALAALAAVVLYDVGRRLSGASSGILAALLFALNVDIARWQDYLLTDSIYISLTVLTVYAVHLAAERGDWWYLAGVCAVAAAASMRPHGRVLGILVAVYWIIRRPSVGAKRWTAIACAVALLAGAIVLSRAAIGDEVETPSQWLHQGVVIWADAGSRLAMPADGDSSAAAYTIHHPRATATLAATRVWTELLHARPSYSRRHNAAVIVALVFTYSCALMGLARTWRDPLAQLIAAVVVVHLAIVAGTFADWDGRFLLYVLPLITTLAACGLVRTAGV